MNRLPIFVLALFISCLKFEFESPYEDANGIYLQWIGSYPASGKKVIVIEKTGYFLRDHYYTSSIEKYTITTDSVNFIGEYLPNKLIGDFAINDDYAFLAIPEFGLEVINFQGAEPFLYGELEISESPKFIRLNDDYVYLLCDSSLCIIAIQDRKNPALRSQIKFEKSTRYFEVLGNYAYVLLDNPLLPQMNEDFLILDIENPSAPQKITHSCKDTIPEIRMFTIDKDYIYFLTDFGLNIEVYKLESEKNLSRLSPISFPQTIRFIYTKENYGLALSNNTIYLLNLEYPDKSCISEVISLPGEFNYGLISGNYIYLLNPNLNIVAIKEVPK